MLIRNVLLVSSAISLTPLMAVGQPSPATRRDAIGRHLEVTYVTFSGGVNLPGGYGHLDDLLVEADLNPHVTLFAGRNVLLNVTPRVRLRILAEPLAPVPTPSFMPNATLFFGFGDGYRPADRGGFTYFTVQVGHHSNGETGSFYAPDGSINTESGSYAANWTAFSVSRIWHAESTSQTWTQLGLVWQPGYRREPRLDGQHEELKLEVSASGWRAVPRVDDLGIEVRAYVSYVLAGRSYNVYPRPGSGLPAERASVADRFDVSLSVRIGRQRLGGLRLFLKYDHRFDYYNINFWRRLHRLQVGVAGDPN